MMKYRVTLSLLAISVLIQLVATFQPAILPYLAFRPFVLFGWLGLLTHALAHANWPHLLGNFSFGLPFMLYLENRMGGEDFLKFYALCGLSSAGLMMVMEGIHIGMIGSSGAIMGVAMGACLSFGESRLQHALGLLMAMSLIIPQLMMAPIGDILGIAVYGHIGGALAAMCLSTRLFPPPKV